MAEEQESMVEAASLALMRALKGCGMLSVIELVNVLALIQRMMVEPLLVMPENACRHAGAKLTSLRSFQISRPDDPCILCDPPDLGGTPGQLKWAEPVRLGAIAIHGSLMESLVTNHRHAGWWIDQDKAGTLRSKTGTKDLVRQENPLPPELDDDDGVFSPESLGSLNLDGSLNLSLDAPPDEYDVKEKRKLVLKSFADIVAHAPDATEAKRHLLASTRPQMNSIREARYAVKCPTCGALPGEWCHAPGGTRQSYQHVARKQPID